MGILRDLFGGAPTDDGEGSNYASSRNSAEQQASADYMSEALQTGRDPVPTTAPEGVQQTTESGIPPLSTKVVLNRRSVIRGLLQPPNFNFLN